MLRRRGTAGTLLVLVSPIAWPFVLLEKGELQDVGSFRQATLPFSDRRLQPLSSSILTECTSLPCGVIDEGIAEDTKVEIIWPEETSDGLKKRRRKLRPTAVRLTLGSIRPNPLPASRKHLLLAIPRPQQLERMLRFPEIFLARSHSMASDTGDGRLKNISRKVQ
ncbi:unnamed protein product [Symbiodinium natans]|uniref:Uncharacterized protein n=1 Tax=Symbiodinium natans TaxID=878477 RepID=A0A812L6K2_9DINO|nr:unnamed protein product [Symbiodinium natans]